MSREKIFPLGDAYYNLLERTLITTDGCITSDGVSVRRFFRGVGFRDNYFLVPPENEDLPTALVELPFRCLTDSLFEDFSPKKLVLALGASGIGSVLVYALSQLVS
ncbi:hypothetical protein COU61_03525 [Candidatus Pacearchaeota archaeon CG10_big_fil_rev_8_21_14_0_10_35_13]|nr:MAG: hypothetical protein COU61_03525 [Candidatus Pacearchaeota archaeon CG10_big_fil_rev_8_21_14_0_10_35_13]